MDDLKAFYYSMIYEEGAPMFDELEPTDLVALRRSFLFDQWKAIRSWKAFVSDLLKAFPLFSKN